MPSSVALADPQPVLAGAPHQHARRLQRLQRWRRATQLGFFALFLAAPALDLLRFDLHTAQLWLLGAPWHLGIDAFLAGQASATDAALGIVLRGMLPALLLVGGFLAVARRFGRVYCGWLCPHFSLVESLNGLLQRASGKLSFWTSTPRRAPAAPPTNAGGRPSFWPAPASASCGRSRC